MKTELETGQCFAVASLNVIWGSKLQVARSPFQLGVDYLRV